MKAIDDEIEDMPVYPHGDVGALASGEAWSCQEVDGPVAVVGHMRVNS